VNGRAARSSHELALLAWTACAHAADKSKDVIADGVYLAAQRLVSIGDRRLNFIASAKARRPSSSTPVSPTT
jgi:hypothetical protein